MQSILRSFDQSCHGRSEQLTEDERVFDAFQRDLRKTWVWVLSRSWLPMWALDERQNPSKHFDFQQKCHQTFSKVLRFVFQNFLVFSLRVCNLLSTPTNFYTKPIQSIVDPSLRPTIAPLVCSMRNCVWFRTHWRATPVSVCAVTTCNICDVMFKIFSKPN